MSQNWANQPQPNWNRGTRAWGQPPYGQGQPAQGYGVAPQPYPGQQAPQAQYPQTQYPQAPQAGYPQQPQYQQPQPQYPQAQYRQAQYQQMPPQGVRYVPPVPVRGRRRGPGGGIVLGLAVLIGVTVLGFGLMQFLTDDDPEVATRTTQTTNPTQSGAPTSEPTDDPTNDPTNEPAGVPTPDRNPPAVPAPKTYGEAEEWLVDNAVYNQSTTAPTPCKVDRINSQTATTEELNTHLNGLTACLWKVWSGPLEKAGYTMPRPPVKVHDQPITTACGKLDSVNAVYCSLDQRIYYAKPLWKIFPAAQRSAPLAIESVIAHEFGHAIQARTGILVSSSAWEQMVAKEQSSSAAKVFSRRLETQADCLSGMFAKAIGESSGLSKKELSNLGEVFYAFGDDVLSNKKDIDGDHGHGSSRQRWFNTGLETTSVGKCNTYVAPKSSVR